jgi:hypothetical protein
LILIVGNTPSVLPTHAHFINTHFLPLLAYIKKPDARTILWPQKFGDDRDNQLWFAVDNFIINVCSRLSLDIRGCKFYGDYPRFITLTFQGTD